MEPGPGGTDFTALYAVLSRLFSYPLDAETLALTAELSLDDAPTEVAAPLQAALARTQAPLAHGGDPAALIETLNSEATRLFEGPGLPMAPPFGSFYLNGRQLMGREAMAVRCAYLAARLLPVHDGRVPADHLAVELGFMAALERGSRMACEAARDFVARHLLTWVPTWRADVLAAAPHPFFAGLVTLTQAVLEADLASLDHVIPEFALERMSAVGDGQ